MKKLITTALAIILGSNLFAQTTTIVLYDCNGVSSYPASPSSAAANITCSATSSETNAVYNGAATGSGAFTPVTTAGDAFSMANSSGTNTRYYLFHVSGSDLTKYQGFRMYFQSQRSSTGATTITVATSTDGTSYTNLSSTLTVQTAFNENVIDLSNLNGAQDMYIKLLASGATSTQGTLRIDNIEIQGSSTPWQTSGGNVGFSGRIGVGNSNPQYPLDVTGTARVSGDQIVGGKVVSAQGYMFDNTNGLKYLAATGNTGAVYQLGGGNIVSPQSSCITPNSNSWLGINGGFIARVPLGQGAPNVNSSLTMMSAPWDGSGLIEVEGSDNNGGTSRGLLVNYFCGRDVVMCTGQFGGVVTTGNNFEAGFANRDLNITANINAVTPTGASNQKIGVSSYTQHNADNGFNTRISVNRDLTKAIGVVNVVNGANPVETFKVWGNGRTQIGALRPNANSTHDNAMLSVDGKIACREVRVFTDANYWSDYVFDKDYKLLSLSEVENYYKENKHLPGVPSAKEIETNGNNLAEIDATLLKKIEENTMYIVELNKKLELLQQENEKLNQKVKVLSKKNAHK